MTSNPNPFAPFVARMDDLVPALEGGTLDDAQKTELVDLIRRAMFVLVNHINAQSQYIRALILDPGPGQDSTDGGSVETPGDTAETSPTVTTDG